MPRLNHHPSLQNMKMTDRFTIVYDLDGTLVDSAPDLLHTLNTVLNRFGYPQTDPDEIGNLVGNGAKAMLTRAFSLMGKPQEPAVLDHLFDEFLNHYVDNLTRHGTAPYPHVVEVLDAFDQAGVAQGICTNKFQTGAEGLLAELNLTRYFPAVLGGNALSVRKPDPLHVTETVRRLGGTLDKAVMVGDSKNDSAAAQAAGIPVILVSYGYTAEPAHKLGADMVIDRFDELPGAIKAVTGQALLD